ncbi:MAG: nucleoside diphosphate kinase regulator [Bacteriovoracaceae bacterium]|nr:nucleoside diphosphate kinase regulator [Bacteriovoracaceae bacterium]
MNEQADNNIMVSDKDLARIMSILNKQESSDFDALEVELERANVISSKDVPADLVTMNSIVKYQILEDHKEMTVELVYPNRADSSTGKISILAAMGSALIGLRVGQSIRWSFPNGKIKTLEITQILYQPEANGDWEL